MILPLTEIVGLLQQGVGNLLRETGLALMQAVMEEEVRHLAGERHEQHEGRRASRWGKEDGYCVVDGQKVPIRRTGCAPPSGGNSAWAATSYSSAADLCSWACGTK